MRKTKIYHTHHVSFEQKGSYVYCNFALSPDIWYDIVNISENERYGLEIETERFLINEFIRRILYKPNSNLFIFDSDLEYRNFCTKHNTPYHKQSWFNTVVFEDNLENTSDYIIENSLVFQRRYYPEEEPCVNFIPKFKLPKSNFKQNILKPDFKKFLRIIEQYKIEKLYHFTDRKNLESIKNAGGILSIRNCKNKRIKIPVMASSLSSRELDKRKDLDDYVHLSFSRIHPMMHYVLNRKRNFDPVILEIDPSVLMFSDTLFSNINAADNNANIGKSLSDMLKIKFNLIKSKKYFELEEIEKKCFQSEVLVKSKVGNEMIINLKSIFT